MKRARARSGFTLDVLAEQTGLDRNTISRLENLRRGADLRTVYALARALQISEEELTGDGG